MKPVSQQGDVPRHGVTLVEMLVVIAIIGLLVAMLLPAVQVARESARRVQCASNLRNLASGALAYHGALSRFPPSGTRGGTGSDAGYWTNSWSWMARCLPFIEQQSLHDKLGVEAGGVLPGNQWIKTPIPIGFCPSDGASSISPSVNAMNQDQFFLGNTPMAWSNYKGVMGSNWCWGLYPNRGTQKNCGAYWPCCDVYLTKGDGILFRTDILYRITIDHVTDGTSNTFLIGEDSPYFNPQGGWPYASHAVSTCGMPPNVDLNGRFGRWGDVPPPVALSSEWNTVWQNATGFHSRHPGGLQFANADTSVAFVSDGIELAVYRARSTKAGGEPIGTDP